MNIAAQDSVKDSTSFIYKPLKKDSVAYYRKYINTHTFEFDSLRFDKKIYGPNRRHFQPHLSRRDSLRTLFKQRTSEIITTVFPEDSTLNMTNLIKEFDNTPSFGIYKNNYIISGTTLDGKPDRFNSDAKIQISILQRVTNSVLPGNTYLFVTYTQLAYWDIFRESFPFGDINFNPTIGLGKALIHKNRFLGLLMLQLEHESNGKDEDYSRSWNKISLGTVLKMTPSWTVQAKAWIPLVDGSNNRDIVEYKGWGHFGIDYNYKSDLNVGFILTKRGTSDLSSNITFNIAYKMFKSANQYIFLEYYNGYGESLLDYNRYHHRIRAGIVIKPNFLFVY